MSVTVTPKSGDVLLPGGCYDAHWEYYEMGTVYNEDMCVVWGKVMVDHVTTMRVCLL